MLLQQIVTSIAAAGDAAHEEPAPLLAEPWVFGVSMFGILVVLMFIAWSYTNLGNRHAPTEEHADPHRQHPNKHDRGQGH